MRALGSARPSVDGRPVSHASHAEPQAIGQSPADSTEQSASVVGPGIADTHTQPPPMISINYIPPTPDVESEKPMAESLPGSKKERRSQSQSPERERDRDTSKGKKVQKMLKDRVNKGQARINTISRKIGNGVVRSSGVSLHRSNSAPGEIREFSSSRARP